MRGGRLSGRLGHGEAAGVTGDDRGVSWSMKDRSLTLIGTGEKLN